MTAPTQLSREQLSAFLGEMLLIRRFEEKVTERFRAGDLAGFLHASIGQEAVAVGVCRAMEAGDVFGSTHRAHGHALANGTPANEVMAELYGKLEGCSHGYGGSMHLYDVERGNLGANAVVGGGLPVRPATRSRTCANGSRSTTNSGRISTLRLSASSTPRSHSPKPAPTRSRKTPSSTCTRRPRAESADRRGRKEPMKRDTERNGGLIVVGVDSSEGAKAALRFALGEAKLRQATLRVVHSWQYGYIGGLGVESYAPMVGANLSELRRTAEVALDAVLHEVAPDANGVVIERRVVEGGPATVLVDESRKADLLVVGSRGRGGFAGLLLGSVSQQCAHHAACPVVIVHASAKAAA